MDKTLTVNQKRGSKQRQSKKKKQQQQQPLKVVYITNPMKFNASASEFRALVQGLTGQNADVDDYSRFAHAAAEGVVGGGQEEVAKMAVQKGSSDLSTSGSYEDGGFGRAEMVDNFEGLISSSVWHGDGDVFKH